MKRRTGHIEWKMLNTTTGLLPVNASSVSDALDQAALWISAVIAVMACALVGWLWWYGIMRRWRSGYLELQPTPPRGGASGRQNSAAHSVGAASGDGSTMRKFVGLSPALDAEYGCTLRDV